MARCGKISHPSAASETFVPAHQADFTQLYQDLGPPIAYDHEAQTAFVTIEPVTRRGGTKVRVRGGT